MTEETARTFGIIRGFRGVQVGLYGVLYNAPVATGPWGILSVPSMNDSLEVEVLYPA